MRRWLEGTGTRAALVVALFAGLGLLGLSAWLQPLREGQRAAAAGRYEEALERHAAAEARFDRLPLAKRLLPAAYAASQANQLWALYHLSRHDLLLEKAATAVPQARTHFWAGCALFARAMEEVEPEARIGWLSRASDEFRQALSLAPSDWDAKYDYELSERLLAQLRKDPARPPRELLQLLRPRPREGRAPAGRVG